MPKIELPPKVKCWRCGGRGYRIEYDRGSMSLEGTMSGCSKPCPDCDDGERYVFADLAAAVRQAKLKIEVDEYVDNPGEYCASIIEAVIIDGEDTGVNEIKADATGPNPTTALLMAIEKFNADAR